MRSINAGIFSLLFTTTSLSVMVFFPTVTILSFFSWAKHQVQDSKQKKAGMIFLIIPAKVIYLNHEGFSELFKFYLPLPFETAVF